MSTAALGVWPIEEPAAPEIDLAALVREAGWPCPDGSSRTFHVELETPEPATARVEQREPDGVVVSADLELETGGAVTATGLRAVELHLRRVAAEVRSVRTVLDAPAGAAAARLEVVLGGDPSAEEMDEALGALSFASRGAAREARLLLRDDAVARLYLALFDPDSGAAPRRFEPPDRPAGAVPAAVPREKENRE